MGDALRAAARSWPDRSALVDGGDRRRRWTFAELLRDAERVADSLATRFARGTNVAVWSSNHPEWILLEFGAALAELTLVTLNPALGDQEAASVLLRSECVAAFVEPTFRGIDLLATMARLRPQLPILREVISMDELMAFVGNAQADKGGDLPQVQPQSAAQIQYTSGTTGLPKGAQLSHRGLVDNGWLYATAIGARSEDVWVNPMPLFHTAGCGLATLGALHTGSCQVLMRSFDADVMLDLISAERGTLVLTVPTMLVRLLDAQRKRPRDVTSLRLWTLGGAPVPPELVTRAAAELDIDLAIGFGQTEASPYITHTIPHDRHPQWAHTVGEQCLKPVDRVPGMGTRMGVPSR